MKININKINKELDEKINDFSHYLIPVDKIHAILHKYDLRVNLNLYINVNTLRKCHEMNISLNNQHKLYVGWDFSNELGTYAVTCELLERRYKVTVKDINKR